MNIGSIKRLATPKNLVIGAGLALLGYVGYVSLQENNENKKKRIVPDFMVVPQVIKPFDPINIVGRFIDDNTGEPTKVPQAYFHIILDSGPPGNKIVASGLLGKNIEEFNKTISIPVNTRGSFSVEVADKLLEEDEIQIANVPPIPQGMNPMRPGVNANPFSSI